MSSVSKEIHVSSVYKEIHVSSVSKGCIKSVFVGIVTCSFAALYIMTRISGFYFIFKTF